MPAPGQHAFQDTLPAANTQNIKRLVLAGAQTLLHSQSGALCLFNTAAGYTFILPAPTADTIGSWFEFLHTVTNTSVVAKVITDAATSFLIGQISIASGGTPGATTGPLAFACDGTSHRAINQGGANTTTGGVIGSRFKVQQITATQWAILDSALVGTATVVTPVATS